MPDDQSDEPEPRDPYEPVRGKENGAPSQGEIKIVAHEGSVIMQFDQPVRQATFTKEEAKSLGGTLINIARKVDKPSGDDSSEPESGAESGEES